MNQKQFKDLCDGYGFVEVPHNSAEGTYCTGCMVVHKRPTKMYADRPAGKPQHDIMCRSAVIHYYAFENYNL